MNTISYEQNGKYAVVDNIRFCRDNKTGYYLNSTLKIRLHRYVYEKAYGEIPKGHEVHHVNHNRNDNEPENLILVTAEEHKRIHSESLTDEDREKRRKNMINNAVPATKEWHGSSEGKEWHKRHYAAMHDKLHEESLFKCENCGKEFYSVRNGRNRFCSDTCKAAFRRKEGTDNEQRKCEYCGKLFAVNKYKKTKCCCRSCSVRQRRENKTDNTGAARSGV